MILWFAAVEVAVAAAAGVLCVVDEIAHVIQETLGTGGDLLALGRQFDTASCSLDEGDAERRFEILDLHR